MLQYLRLPVSKTIFEVTEINYNDNKWFIIEAVVGLKICTGWGEDDLILSV